MLYTICGPSKVGKTTILTELLSRKPNLYRLVTFTSRAPRINEINGIDYYFVSRDYFKYLVDMNLIVYPISYRGEFYGIYKCYLEHCNNINSITILRPDGIPYISHYTPITGIYVEML